MKAVALAVALIAATSALSFGLFRGGSNVPPDVRPPAVQPGPPIR